MGYEGSGPAFNWPSPTVTREDLVRPPEPGLVDSSETGPGKGVSILDCPLAEPPLILWTPRAAVHDLFI
jgi:hypothetical protein